MSLQTKTEIPPFSAEHIEAICRIIGDKTDGLTPKQIGEFLVQMKIADPTPGLSKWKRLFNALVAFQNQYKLGNAIVVFITRAMNPSLYNERALEFEDRRLALNRILSFNGYSIRGDGKITKCDKATVQDEAFTRFNHFQAQLISRGVHDAVFQYCSPEILARGYLYSVFLALKNIAAKVRLLSGLEGEGAELIERAFSLGKSGQPLVAINGLETDTLKGEQRAFLHLAVGLFGTVRNPLAHNVKLDWSMPESDALDVMCLVSLVHRKLDAASKIQPISG
jgi:uncharacterized protein (TIGR02391 family)